MAECYLYRSGFAFLPASQSDMDILYQFKENEPFKVKVTKARNYENHKRFFALLKLGFENQESFTAPEWFRTFITMKAGYVESCQGPDGNWMFRPKSIAFDKLDELEFRELYRAVSQQILDYCKISQKQLEDNLNLFT
jgi:hypothetical protein